MIFNSVTYLLFLLFVVALSWALPQKSRLYLLFVSSIIFYGFWRFEFVFLMLTSVVIDYYLALAIYKAKTKKLKKGLLVTSLFVNLGLLILFKYSSFIAFNLVDLFGIFGVVLVVDPFFLDIVLPLGISFYTFQTISYVVDVYRGFIKPERKFVLFATYVTFFPQLIAGPILRAKEVIPQLNLKPIFKMDDLQIGFRRIVIGLFIKVVLADNIAPLVDAGFASDISTLSAFDIWTLAFLFGFQIYFDFSAYSHIAIGCARMMGINFPENFNFPYMSCTPKQFWNRWHISLSSWIRDYLYLPLTNQKVHDRSIGGLDEAVLIKPSQNNVTYALFATWAIMGLWHGANWTFVTWGLYHALVIYIYRLIPQWFNNFPSKIMTILGVSITLPVMMLGWVPFRADSVNISIDMFLKVLNPSMYTWLGLRENTYIIASALVIGSIVVYNLYGYFKELEFKKPSEALVFEAIFLSILLPMVYIFLRPISQFIYFQF